MTIISTNQTDLERLHPCRRSRIFIDDNMNIWNLPGYEEEEYETNMAFPPVQEFVIALILIHGKYSQVNQTTLDLILFLC